MRRLSGILNMAIVASCFASFSAAKDPIGIDSLLAEGSFEEALPLLHKSLDEEDSQAALLLGILHTIGAGVRIDYAKAEKFFASARYTQIAETPPPANLASYYGNGLVFKYRASIDWNETAATRGNVDALANLIHFAQSAPNLIATSNEEIIQRLQEAAQDSPRAVGILLKLVRQGSDVFAVDQLDDLALAKRGAEWEEPTAMLHLAEALLENEDTPIEVVMDLLDKSAAQGLAEAIALRDSTRDSPRGLEALSSSRLDDLQDERSSRDLKELVERAGRDDLESQYALSELIDLSRVDEAALEAYGGLLAKNRDLRLTQPDDYISRLLEAGENGNQHANYLAGVMLLRGRWGLKSEPERALAILEENGRDGHVPSQLTTYHSLLNMGAIDDDFTRVDALAAEFRSMGDDFDRYLARHYERIMRREEAKIEIPSEAEIAQRVAAIEQSESGDSYGPKPVFQAQPVYPYELRRRGIEGTVTISFIVDSEGVVREPEAVTEEHSDFISSAESSVQKWRFAPGRRNGEVVNTRMQVPIVFSITED